MQLSDFKTYTFNGYLKIDFGNSGNAALQEALDWMYGEQSANKYLAELSYITNKWNSLDELVESNYGGYWDEELLTEYSLTGHWFCFREWDCGTLVIINKENKLIRISQEVLPDMPVVMMSFHAFTDVIEQWKKKVAEFELNKPPGLSQKKKGFWQRMKKLFKLLPKRTL